MPSTYSAGIGLELPANGEQSGTWGTTVNRDFTFLDAALYGGVVITLSSTPYALNISDGLACDARNAFIVFGGSPAADVTVTLGPNTYHRVFWAKNTTAKNITFTQGAGASLILPAGASAMVFADGAGAGAAVTGVSVNPLVGVMTFAQSSAPSMDGVSRQWSDSGGSRYDALSHKFDAYVASARKTILNLTSSGEALLTTDKCEISGTPASESVLSIKKTGSAGPSNLLWSLAHQTNGKDLWAKSHDGTTTKAWMKWLHDTDLLCFTNGKVLVGTETSSSSDIVQVAGGVKATSFTGTVALTNLPQSGATDGQAIGWDDGASAWAPISVLTALGPGSVTMSMLSQSGASSGQVITWNGSAWAPAAVGTSGVVITKSATIPTSSGSAGDIVLNSAVTGGKHAGWICLGGTSWKKFGIVEL